VRQSDLVTLDELAVPLTVIGTGGIGSPTALGLAKMGCSQLTLYDPDVVEPHNLPSQLFRLSDVHQSKVRALQDVIRAFTGHEATAKLEELVDQRLSGVVISAVDSMAARKTIWTKAVQYQAGIDVYIDARMGAEVCRIYSVRPSDPEDVRSYAETLYDDGDALDEPCTARATFYTALVIAGLICNQVKKHVRGETLSREIIFDLKTLTLLVAGGSIRSRPAEET
jgi:molybdopterin/thiamine biosynthesis adenylyltransferase